LNPQGASGAPKVLKKIGLSWANWQSKRLCVKFRRNFWMFLEMANPGDCGMPRQEMNLGPHIVPIHS
jgi:hypothetical protein